MNEPRLSKAASLIRVTVVYVVALAVATVWLLVGPDTDHLWLDAFIADLMATVVVWFGSRVLHNSSCYDPYWSVLPPYLAVYWLLASDPVGLDDTRTVLLLVVIWVWAIRLTANWIQDWPGLHHEDWRYIMLRENSGRAALLVDFSAVHLFPTLVVFAGMIPAYAVLQRPGKDLNALDIVATIIGVGAALLQFVSDAQMRRFIRNRQPGQAMDQGLWAWSRHPNYFGEIAFWYALALFGIAAAPSDWWWLLLGAIAMTAMFLGASIPMMEKRSLERRPTYQEIIDRVSMLVPLPPRRPKA